MTISMKTFLSRVALPGALLMLVSQGAMATCSFMDSRFGPNDSVALNFGTVIVQRDTPVGTVVATVSNNTLGGRNNFIQCNAPGYTSQWAAGGAFAPVVYNGETLYESGVAGLAFRVVTPGAGSTTGRYGTRALPRQISNVACASSAPAAWYRLCGGTWGSLRVQLVKIAATTGSGPFSSGSLVQALVVGETPILDHTLSSGAVQTVACSVTNNNIWVSMGDVKNTVFSGIGSSADSTDFKIDLNCDASTNVNLTLQPGNAGASAVANGVLNLDTPDTNHSARGVGVQMLYNGNPVVFGTRFRVATTSDDGAFAISLQARYLQTATTIRPGQATANATFTLTYQ